MIKLEELNLPEALRYIHREDNPILGLLTKVPSEIALIRTAPRAFESCYESGIHVGNKKLANAGSAKFLAEVYGSFMIDTESVIVYTKKRLFDSYGEIISNNFRTVKLKDIEDYVKMPSVLNLH